MYKRITKPAYTKGRTPKLGEAVPYMIAAADDKGGCVFGYRHFVYDTLDGVYPFSLTTRIIASYQIFLLKEETNNQTTMIAQINPKTREVRYFDIRKLTPRECYRLMGVPEDQINLLMATVSKPHLEYPEDCYGALELLGLDATATPRDIDDAVLSLTDEGGEAACDAGCETDDDEDGGEQWDTSAETAEEREERLAPIRKAADYLRNARRIQVDGPVPVLAQSAHYKLAGNSIVCDVLLHIYEELMYPTGRRIQGEQVSMFQRPQYRLTRDWQAEPFRLVTLCSGYDSQAIACGMLRRRHPDFRYDLVAWAEFDPESNRALDEQPAVVAHNLVFPDKAHLNLGDMTKIDWPQFMDGRLTAGDVDLLTYSTPCQSISQAGKREGIARGSGTRSSVLWSTIDAVQALRPKVLLQENVGALINRQNIGDFHEWCGLLEEEGYENFLAPEFPLPWSTNGKERHTKAGILNAKWYGVPQNRDRVYMVSVRSDLLQGAQYEFPRPFALDRCIADVLEPDAADTFFLKPESVTAFLRKNEQDPMVYVTTDHKFTEEEIDSLTPDPSPEGEGRSLTPDPSPEGEGSR